MKGEIEADIGDEVVEALLAIQSCTRQGYGLVARLLDLQHKSRAEKKRRKERERESERERERDRGLRASTAVLQHRTLD